MNAAAAIGWAILFLVVGVCAFVWDRNLSLRNRRLKTDAAGQPQRKRFPISVGAGISLAGSLAYVVLMGYAYLSGGMPLASIVALTVVLLLGSLVMMNLVWFTSDLLREGNLGKRAMSWLRSSRFQLWQLMGFMGAVAVVAGIVRACYPNESIGMWLMMTAGFSLLLVLFGAISYLGIDTLRFGRGSGRRVNRLQELRERRRREREEGQR